MNELQTSYNNTLGVVSLSLVSNSTSNDFFSIFNQMAWNKDLDNSWCNNNCSSLEIRSSKDVKNIK
jgi:hypothetical protein